VDGAKILHAEVRDVVSRYSTDVLNKYSSKDPEKLLEKSSIFLGEVRVPLAETLPLSAARLALGGENSDAGESIATKREFVLARRDGADRVSGCISLSFEWNITAASLLKQKLRVLEQVLTTRNEILSMLAPRPIERPEVTEIPHSGAKPLAKGSRIDPESTQADGARFCPSCGAC
jgi:hypothetical protein